MFDRIAGRYDRLNRILSLGRDVGWRQYAVNLLKAGPVLDVATGTGDFLGAAQEKQPTWEFFGIDPSPNMLAIGKAKWGGTESAVDFRLGAAESIPFEDGRFGSVTIGFGIRNVDDRPRGLAEMVRVLKRGGRVVILEFGQPEGRIFGPLYRFYFSRILPRIGGWISDREAYQYLHDSVCAFPSAEAFCEMMETAGLIRVRTHPLTLGIVNCFVGEKPTGEVQNG